MLLEQYVFNLKEVGERSFEDIKRECLFDFVGHLRGFIYREEEEDHRGASNFKRFSCKLGNFIKFNTKNIIFEMEVSAKGLLDLCAAAYGLELVRETKETSCYYKYREDNLTLNIGEWIIPEHDPKVFREKLRTFNRFFGTEFPNVKIYVFRIGNRDHFFYTLIRS